VRPSHRPVQREFAQPCAPIRIISVNLLVVHIAATIGFGSLFSPAIVRGSAKTRLWSISVAVSIAAVGLPQYRRVRICDTHFHLDATSAVRERDALPLRAEVRSSVVPSLRT
jgi:hypothetical protein